MPGKQENIPHYAVFDAGNVAAKFVSSNGKFKLSGTIFTKPNVKSKTQFDDVITQNVYILKIQVNAIH